MSGWFDSDSKTQKPRSLGAPDSPNEKNLSSLTALKDGVLLKSTVGDRLETVDFVELFLCVGYHSIDLRFADKAFLSFVVEPGLPWNGP